MPKVVDADEKRAALVAASRSLIAAGGVGAATLRRVATEAGCTTGAVTHWFSDRQALLMDALGSAHQAAAVRMLTRAAGAADDRERLRRVVDESLPLDETRLQEWRVWLAFWAEALGNPALAAENARRTAEWRALLVAVLAPLVPDAESEASRWMAMIDGLGLRVVLAHAAGADATEAVRAEVALALGRLGASET